MKQFGRAVVIGKFYPPHLGHHLLIDTALVHSQSVTVLLCVRPTDVIDGALRLAWLREMHPRARVEVIDDRYDADDTLVWAENTIRRLGRAPDAVFASEDYGQAYADAMGSAYVAVDPGRVRVPCSGTRVRTDCYAEWEFLAPPVRSWFALKVCVLGAESTGTTTLAQSLAAHYDTVWVPEYGREYSVTKQVRGESAWKSEEFVAIAREQVSQEEAAARRANRIVISDTNAFATTLWHRRYMGGDSTEVAAIAQQTRCDLYLLTGDEIPFVQDGLRDGEAIRHHMHGWFEDALGTQAVPWVVLRGSPEGRIATAVEVIDARLRELAPLSLRVAGD